MSMMVMIIGGMLQVSLFRLWCGGDDDDDDDAEDEDNDGLKFALCHTYVTWIYILRIYKHL
jgi:hypothetical protein